MKRRGRSGRVRRAPKWAGLVACMLTALIWLSSPFWFVQRVQESYGGSLGGMSVRQVGAGAGLVWFGSAELASGRNYFVERTAVSWSAPPTRGALAWLPSWRFENGALVRRLDLALPLWMPFLGLALPTAWLWRRDRRAPLTPDP